jgi:hypothetical protein
MKFKIICFLILLGFIKLYGQENIIYGRDTFLIPTQKAPQKYFCYHSNINGLISSAEDVQKNIYKQKGIRYNTCDAFPIDSFNIDFNKYGIIFLHLSNNTCSMSDYTLINFRLYKLLKEKKYLLVVNAKGFCEDKVGRWVNYRELMPKMEEGYTFECRIIE